MQREPTAAFAIKARSAFRDLVFDGEVPWLGDKAAWNEKSCGFGVFDAMATKEATRELSYQLFDFAHSAKKKAEPHFSFRFGGQRFYVIGMHAHSSHAAHRFRWPTLVFNPH